VTYNELTCVIFYTAIPRSILYCLCIISHFIACNFAVWTTQIWWTKRKWSNRPFYV